MKNNTTRRKKLQFPVLSPVPVLILVIFLLCAASLLYLFSARSASCDSAYACIYQNGTLLKTIDLSRISAPYSFTIESPDGGFNTITLRPAKDSTKVSGENAPGTICISDADCPDRLCVSMGESASSLLPIVCLPHGLVIQIKETAPDIDILTY